MVSLSGPYRRLLEFAAAYYDVKTFPPGETRRALERVYNKKSGGAGGKNSGGYNSAAGGDDTREKKRRKKEKGSGR